MSVFWKLLAESPPTNPTNHHQPPLPPLPTNPTNHQLTRHLGPGLGGTTGVGAGVQGLGIWPPPELLEVGGFDLGAHRKPRVIGLPSSIPRWQWKITISSRRYIFIPGPCFIAMLVYQSVPMVNQHSPIWIHMKGWFTPCEAKSSRG